MKKMTFFAFVLLLVYGSCKDSKNIGSDTTNSSKVVDTHTSENALDWIGTYKGSIPNLTCKKMYSTVILHGDNTYERTEDCESGELELMIEKGDFSWSTDRTEIKLHSQSKSPSVKFSVLEGALQFVISDGAVEKGDLAEQFSLKKFEASQILGSYVKGEKGKGYFDELNIEQIEKEIFKVSISSGKARKGCSFEGKGKLINDRIVINLVEYDDRFSSRMIIRFDTDRAFIFTENEKQKYDLMFFCGGGGSLIGGYKKS